MWHLCSIYIQNQVLNPKHLCGEKYFNVHKTIREIWVMKRASLDSLFVSSRCTSFCLGSYEHSKICFIFSLVMKKTKETACRVCRDKRERCHKSQIIDRKRLLKNVVTTEEDLRETNVIIFLLFRLYSWITPGK